MSPPEVNAEELQALGRMFYDLLTSSPDHYLEDNTLLRDTWYEDKTLHVDTWWVVEGTLYLRPEQTELVTRLGLITEHEKR